LAAEGEVVSQIKKKKQPIFFFFLCMFSVEWGRNFGTRLFLEQRIRQLPVDSCQLTVKVLLTTDHYPLTTDFTVAQQHRTYTGFAFKPSHPGVKAPERQVFGCVFIVRFE
jgi:hypothetical protein